MCLTLRTEFPSHAIYKTVSSLGGLRADQTLGGKGGEQQALNMPSGLMIRWGLVTPEEMAEVLFRALHSFTQQMVLKSLGSWSHSQMVNTVRSLTAVELAYQAISRGTTSGPPASMLSWS